MENNLTALSLKSYEKIFTKKMSVDEALIYLNDEMPLRTFNDIINSYNISASELTDRLYACDQTVKRDNLARKVRDWYKGAYEPSSREIYLMLCFALGLGEEESELFLRVSTDYGFHLRSQRELAYAYSLRKGKSYAEAVELYNSLPPEIITEASKNVYTENVALRFREVDSDEGFISFIRENSHLLGNMHNTAYDYFMRYINILQRPMDIVADAASKHYSVEDITELYIRMGVPESKKNDGHKLVRIIKKYWPSVTSVRRMLERTEDVGRKTLILLALVTEEELTGDSWDAYYMEELDPGDVFESKYTMLNLILTKCGYSPIDPRSPFDWLVLWSMRSDDDEFITERMEKAIERLFSGINEADIV